MAQNKKTSQKSTKTNKKTSDTKNTVKKVETAKKIAAPKKVETVKKVETKEVVKEPKVEVKATKKENNKFITFVKDNSRNLILGLICILLIANIILVVIGHKVKLENGKEVIASIDGKSYTADQLFDSLKNKYGKDILLTLIDEHINSKELSSDDLANAKKEANEYIDGIKKQYESAGYTWADVLSQYGYTDEDALLNDYLVSVKSKYVVKNYLKKQLTDDEIKKYYDENIFGTYTVKHILIKPDTTDEMSDEEKTAAEEAAKVTAQEVISKYTAGEDWATLVSTYSEDEGSKEKEGLVENFTKGDMEDEFFNATIKLKDGESTVEPVKTSYGYHVILRVSSTEKDSLKDSKDEVISALIDKKLSDDSKLNNSTWVKIRNDYKLSIKDSTIKSNYEKTISE